MSTFDDPNREAIGLPPIWTGAGEEPPPEGDELPDEPEVDPSAYTVAQLTSWAAGASPDAVQAALDAEEADKNRAGAVNALQAALDAKQA